MSAGPPEWAAYLESLAAFGMRPGLERVSALLESLGRPQDAYRVIHVVGTNGKSSTTRYCEALLRAHGARAGAYLSPHISGWTERVVVDGRPRTSSSALTRSSPGRMPNAASDSR